MSLARILFSLLLAAVLLLPAEAQDVVRLRNGKTLAGTILRDELLTESFRIRLWDTGGVLRISWSQVPSSEKDRILGIQDQPVSGDLGDLIEGIRVLTATREVIGVLVQETPTSLSIKTADSPTPVPIPVAGVLRRESLQIREGEAYAPAERVARRASSANDGRSLLSVAEYAAGLSLYDSARELLARAKAADPSLGAEIDRRLAEMDSLAKEHAAEKALAAVRALLEEAKFDEALKAADDFLRDHEGTKTAAANAELRTSVERDRQSFLANQDKFLAENVEKAWRSMRSSLLRSFVGSKHKLDEARSLASGLDTELKTKLAEKFKTTPEKIEEFWRKRGVKPETASYGTGSWIALGGQDGGMDYQGPDEGSDDPIDDFVKKFGDDGKKKPPQKEQNRKIQTSEDWWESAGSSVRSEWIEAHYAESSPLVEIVRKEQKDCSQCSGKGTLKSTRYGKAVEVVCPRCHGTKFDVKIHFK